MLVVAMLPPHRLKALYAYSLKLGVEPLVEVNSANEMAAALDLGAIGVNRWHPLRNIMFLSGNKLEIYLLDGSGSYRIHEPFG